MVASEQQRSYILRRMSSVDLEAVIAQSTNHVEVEGEHEATAIDRGMSEPVFRAEQPFFFAVPERKKNRSSWRFGKLQQSFSDFKDCCGATGIVISSVVDVSNRAVAIAPRPVADVIVMGSHDDDFSSKFGVAPWENR